MPNLLILGASSDIASACAQQFASAGFNVFLAGRNIDGLQTLSADITIRHSVQSGVLFFDALDYPSHQPFVQSLSFVPDVVLIAFGYLGNQELAQNSWAEANLIIGSNYTGAVSITNAIASLLETKQKGVIVGISSIAGVRGKKNNYIYGSAKAGYTAYLSGLRNRLFSKHVHIISVLPGYVETKMTSGMKLPAPLTAQPGAVAADIYKAVIKRKNIIYTKPLWRYIMLIIKNIPENIYKKLTIG